MQLNRTENAGQSLVNAWFVTARNVCSLINDMKMCSPLTDSGIRLITANTVELSGRSGWIMCSALEMRKTLANAHTAAGVFMTVNIAKMSLSRVKI